MLVSNDLCVLGNIHGMECVTMAGDFAGLIWEPGDGMRYIASITRISGRIVHAIAGKATSAWVCTLFSPCSRAQTIVASNDMGPDMVMSPEYVIGKINVFDREALAIACALNIALPCCSTAYGQELLRTIRRDPRFSRTRNQEDPDFSRDPDIQAIKHR